jgi:hypothetical protein
MTHFEYLAIFISFLYAGMVGRIFVTLSGLSLKTLNWQHVGWLAVLFINLIQAWWKGWSFHDAQMNYGLYVAYLAHTVPFMFTVGVLTPVKDPGNWTEYFQAVRVRFFLSYGLFWLTLLISNYIFTGDPFTTLVPVILSIIGATVRKPVVQWILLAFFTTIFLMMGIAMTTGAVS